MTFSEILNRDLDFAALAHLARRGLAWWAAELASMLPASWAARLTPGPRLWAEPRPEGGWRLWKDGRRLEAEAPPGSDAGPIGLIAPAEAVLSRVIEVPRLPPADIRRLVALDIDRLSPLAPELIHFDVEIAAAEDGGQAVRLAMIRRADAARLLALARAAGVEPAALAIWPEDGAATAPRFDFMPQIRAAEGAPADGARGHWPWLAVAGLILVNLAVLTGRDIVATTRLRETVEGQRPAVEASLRLRRRIETEEASRRDLIERGRRSDPLRLLSVLTQALPRDAWIQRLEWNGALLRVTGQKGPGDDMAAAIRGSGAFANPRPAAATPRDPARGDGVGVGDGGGDRAFDLLADARPGVDP